MKRSEPHVQEGRRAPQGSFPMRFTVEEAHLGPRNLNDMFTGFVVFCYDSSDSGDNKCLWLAAVYVATIHLDNNEKPIPKMVWEITSEEDGCWRHLRLKLTSIHSCHFPNIYSCFRILFFFSKPALLLSHRTSTERNIDVMISFEALFEAGDFHSSCRCRLIDWKQSVTHRSADTDNK